MEALADFSFDELPDISGSSDPVTTDAAANDMEVEVEPVGDMPMGVYKDMSNHDYHSSKAISKSGLDRLELSPAHLWYYQQEGSRRSHALDLGSLFHDAILMPDGYVENHYPVMPEFNLRSTAGRQDKEDWLSMLASWQVPVTVADMEMVEAMKNSIYMHPEAGWLVRESRASGECENSHFAIDDETFTYVRCRPDLKLMSNGLLGDLKSTEDCSKRAFEHSMNAYRYHVQDAMYRHVVEQTEGSVDDFLFIATEKKADRPVTAIYRLSDEDYQEGWELYRAGIERYSELLAGEGFTAPITAELPRYARKF